MLQLIRGTWKNMWGKPCILRRLTTTLRRLRYPVRKSRVDYVHWHQQLQKFRSDIDKLSPRMKHSRFHVFFCIRIAGKQSDKDRAVGRLQTANKYVYIVYLLFAGTCGSDWHAGQSSGLKKKTCGLLLLPFFLLGTVRDACCRFSSWSWTEWRKCSYQSGLFMTNVYLSENCV